MEWQLTVDLRASRNMTCVHHGGVGEVIVSSPQRCRHHRHGPRGWRNRRHGLPRRRRPLGQRNLAPRQQHHPLTHEAWANPAMPTNLWGGAPARSQPPGWLQAPLLCTTNSRLLPSRVGQLAKLRGDLPISPPSSDCEQVTAGYATSFQSSEFQNCYHSNRGLSAN